MSADDRGTANPPADEVVAVTHKYGCSELNLGPLQESCVHS